MHNSALGQPMRYDSSLNPADRLLRAETATALCLACHSGGATSQGPNVRAPSDWDPPGGGFPADLSDPDHTAHAIGPDPVIPPDGDTPVVMTCGTCHDPHGNGAYRNLRPNPSGNPGRTGVAPVAVQTVLPNGSNSAQVYTRANVRYVSGMSQWCMTCHNLIAEDLHSLSHPYDQAIWGAIFADYPSWSEPIVNRVPVQNALAQPAPNQADQVFCLSCHKAHGSPNLGAVIYADGDMTSTCSQCHDQ
jgi:predicted CXXCH cytochrome family protein